MLKDGQIVCDSCQKVISRSTSVLEGNGEKLHNLCGTCFAALKQRSIPPA